MDDQKQFETMAVIRAYAKEIAELSPRDLRPSVAYDMYRRKILRMDELQKTLDCVR